MADPITEFEQYREELLAALGKDDPVAVLRAELEEIPRIVASVSPDQLTRSPAPGEWSAWQVLSHIADSDLMAGTRVRMIVTQDRPTLVGYDQEAWTARFARLDRDVADTVARWRAWERVLWRRAEAVVCTAAKVHGACLGRRLGCECERHHRPGMRDQIEILLRLGGERDRSRTSSRGRS